MMIGDSWTQIGSTIAGLMFTLATLQQFFPHQLRLSLQQFVLASLQQFSLVQKLCDKFVNLFSPYIHITFPEYSGYWSNQAFDAIETYVGALSTTKASLLKGSLVQNSKALVLTRDDRKVCDEFNAVQVWWVLEPSPTSSSEDKYFQLIFRRQHRDLITGSYLDHVIEQGKAIQAKNKQRRLYTNNPSENWRSYKKNLWSDIAFESPATFQTIAMDPSKKEEIINDLVSFSKGKEYYMKLGKPWKRGYLLYGPPGTGKSTMIAAMANFLNYDIYDLELTTVKTNTELRKLLAETSSNKVTLSGILNFIDGTCFEAFKILAKNYLDVDSHDLFEKIGILLKETEMTPADVAENLMPKREKKDPDACLNSLIQALEDAKEKAKLKAEKEKNIKINKGKNMKFYAKRLLF
ncbi:hypothetical protein GOBAR_DD07425 [Gossypium barbadense]|nr:hypothetical protein GOBAR_DD07425 [Gossypium barbadense]